MDKITLIASDFSIVAGQVSNYTLHTDCPIARALKRAGETDFEVFTWHIEWADGRTVGIEGGYDNVEACWKEIAAGAPEAYITVINSNL